MDAAERGRRPLPGGRRTGRRARSAWIGALAGILVLAPVPASAQILTGRVIESGTERPIPTALVRLLDAEERPLVLAVADSAGRYLLEAPAPGRYHVAAERIGYDAFTSHLIEVRDPSATYPVDIEMRPVPLPLPGFTVTAERFQEVRRGIQLVLGVSTKSLRTPPIMRPTIEEHVARAHDLVDLVRWTNKAAIIVIETPEGPCFKYRGRQCLEVYLDDFHVQADLVHTLPLDMAETVVLVMPGESPVYNSGAVLLYTEGWIR